MTVYIVTGYNEDLDSTWIESVFDNEEAAYTLRDIFQNGTYVSAERYHVEEWTVNSE